MKITDVALTYFQYDLTVILCDNFLDSLTYLHFHHLDQSQLKIKTGVKGNTVMKNKNYNGTLLDKRQLSSANDKSWIIP